MRRNVLLCLVVACICFGVQPSAWAQFSRSTPRYGTFGPRALGVPLEPKNRPFSDGLRFGPSGTFEGIRYRFPPWPQPDIGLAAPDIGPTIIVVPEQNVLREVPQVPVPQIVPDTRGLDDLLAAPMSDQEIAPPVAPQPPPPPMPELPLRRTGQDLNLSGESAAMGPAQPTPGQRRMGPQTVSPLQTPGAPAADLRVGFEYGRPVSNRIAASLTQQLTESPRIERLSPIQVQVEGRTAVLRGVVASEYDRRVAEQAVRMQPGIGDVRNDLTVGPSR